ncbi:LysM peptidoglycan-binding domain-containing protein [Oceanobacillus kimchii]|uniref:3D domain-containing protein n=1 Tax=Oceanobacillus kimchii TaxID=746691 RepID=UPI000984EF13|nr:3D domain-containing protein [Oceanobacillus kimchii]MCT1576705.1 LysM peptidoglycan-binding domain-containing protein [Oceanobacillus kimchii]MCT2134775.1 LysM peptidoglycan-binding domain-containing protein [Oceanobacillus kimchii]
MRKLVAALSASIVFTGLAATTVSAESTEHEIQPGESLWEIADQYDTTVEELMDINDLKSTVVHPKDMVYLNNIYTVERGDTLTSISDEFDVKVAQLKEWNNLSTDLIVIDQELSIKGELDTKENKETPQQEQNTSDQSEADESNASESTEESAPGGETISMSATAYTAKCDGCSGVTYTGIDLNSNPNAKVVAVDPNVIPLGSEVYVEGYGYATAADIGSAINGNKIDLHVPTKEEANNFGVQQVDVTIVD